jgi:hypothetical protein
VGYPHPGSGSAGNTSCSNPWGGGHTRTFREGVYYCGPGGTESRSDCMEMRGDMVMTGGRIVGVFFRNRVYI